MQHLSLRGKRHFHWSCWLEGNFTRLPAAEQPDSDQHKISSNCRARVLIETASNRSILPYLNFAGPSSEILVLIQNRDVVEHHGRGTLRFEEDWMLWDSRFRIKADLLGLGFYIDGAEELVEKPICPMPGHYHVPSEGQTVTLADLTLGEATSYTICRTLYDFDLEAYQMQQANVRDLREWLESTVDPKVLRTVCRSHSIRECYENLIEAVGPPDRREFLARLRE